MLDSILSFLHSIPMEWAVSGFLLVVFSGIYLGIKEQLTVYGDYDDLGITFLLVLIPSTHLLLVSFFGLNSSSIMAVFAVFEVLVFVWVIRTTWNENRKVLQTGIALLVKIPLSVIFTVCLIGFIYPTGKNSKQRGDIRRISALLLAVITPITFVLVKRKTGRFNPNSIKTRTVSMG